MSQLDIKIRKLQDNGSTFRANIETLYLGGVRSAKVDRLHFEVPEEWKACTISLHVQRLSGTLPDPQILDENNSVLVDRRWTLEKEGTWMLLAINDSGYIAMTKPGKYTCYDTIDTDTTTENITPSIYEQFVAEVTKYAKQALESMNAAKASEEAAAKSAKEAANSAASMEESVRVSGENAKKAANSAAAAKKSEEAAAKSAEASENSAKKSAESESASKASAEKAKNSEEAAKKSEDAAALSETKSAASEKAAKTSEIAAKRALQDTETEHTAALQNIAQARTAALNDVAASTKTATAAGSASTAATKAGEAEKSKTAAATSATNAKASEEASKNWAEEAKKAANTDTTVSIKGAPADAAATRALIEESLAAQRAEDYARVKFWASNDPTSPASFIGGTWERVEGEFIIGASSAYPVGTTGGSATHTQTTAEMPSHSHSGSTGSAGSHSHSASTDSAGWHSHSGTTDWAGSHSHTIDNWYSSDGNTQGNPTAGYSKTGRTFSTNSAGSHTHSFSTNGTGSHTHTVSIGDAGAHTHTVSIGSTGSGQAMSILNPYYALYIWVRVDDAA